MARTRSTTAAKPQEPAMTDKERAELDVRLEKMFTKPKKSELGGGRFFLLWMQRDDAGSPQMMIWNPETDEEYRAANFFYDAAHGLGAFTKQVAPGKPLQRTSEHDALIHGVLQDRDDDTGYLVYADFLTENGHTQGDFIRLCIEVERLAPDSDEAKEKNDRIYELLEAHGEEWFAPLGELGLRPNIYGTFFPWLWLSARHGVIEEVSIDRPGILPKHAARLFAAAPFLRKLAFEEGHVNPAGIAKVEQLTQIEELDLGHTNLTAGGLRTILQSPYLTALKTFTLSGNDFGDRGAAALTAWEGLAKLDSLDVAGCSLTPAGVAAIGNSKRIANLSRLRIGRNARDAEAAATILGSPHLPRLTELELSNTEFDLATATIFRTACFAATLQELDLESATFQPGAFEQFAKAPLPALRCLKLNSIDLSGSAGALAHAPFLQTLEGLYLDNCNLTATATMLFRQGSFPKLETLDLSRNNIGDAGVVILAKSSDRFPTLTKLKLWDNRLGAKAADALAASPLLDNITELDLNENKLTVAGALALAKSKHVTKITSLTVDEKAIGKKGKQALLDRFGESVVNFR